MKTKRLLCVALILSLLVPFSAVLPASAASAVLVRGDVNGDTVVNASDALLTLKQAVGKTELSEKAASCADVDCSDVVNASDALQILKYAVKKISAFSATGLKGKTLLMGTYYPGKYSAETETGRVWLAKLAAIERKYGVTIQVTGVSANETLLPYDFVEMPNYQCRNAAKGNAVKDLTANAVIDLSGFAGGATESCTMGKQVFGVGTKTMASNPMGLVMNVDLLKKYAPDSYAALAEQVENKTWNFQALSAMIDEYCSKSKTTAFFGSNTNVIGQAIVANAGYEAAFTPDGKSAVCSIASPEGIEAMEYIKGMRRSGTWEYSVDVNGLFKKFNAGSLPAMVYYIGEAANFKGNFELTAVPFPIGPKQTDYVMSTFNCTCFVIPQVYGVIGNGAAAVLNELVSMDEDLSEAQVADMMDRGLDELGGKTVKWATQHTTADFSTGPFDGQVGGPVDASVLNATKKPAEELPKIADLIQQEIDAYYGQFYVK